MVAEDGARDPGDGAIGIPVIISVEGRGMAHIMPICPDFARHSATAALRAWQHLILKK
ncbi:hypothetical protein [Rhizobium sp. CNPSo 4039]|uniref:hypothetical protein n=1 Tax=Rhizobium sp. CNPSo 4039 TaxID=3021409 RepID=UPI00254FAC6D|nr:hypothetical protein [Rhizobium sp. CNPSo 4039]MDK4717135.1 hypothetical protein [Rhizobium sp. CNPSo 4039]